MNNNLTPAETQARMQFVAEREQWEREAAPLMTKVRLVQQRLCTPRYLTQAQRNWVKKAITHMDQFENLPEDPEVGWGYTQESWHEYRRYAHNELCKAAEAFAAKLPGYEQAYDALEELASGWCTDERIEELDKTILPIAKKWARP